MCRFYGLRKTDFEFGIFDQAYEFNEFFDYVFEKNDLVLFFVFKKNIENKKVIKKNVRDYYVNQRGYKKCKFLK